MATLLLQNREFPSLWYRETIFVLQAVYVRSFPNITDILNILILVHNSFNEYCINILIVCKDFIVHIHTNIYTPVQIPAKSFD